jgi:hypothetical protein
MKRIFLICLVALVLTPALRSQNTSEAKYSAEMAKVLNKFNGQSDTASMLKYAGKFEKTGRKYPAAGSPAIIPSRP